MLTDYITLNCIYNPASMTLILMYNITYADGEAIGQSANNRRLIYDQHCPPICTFVKRIVSRQSNAHLPGGARRFGSIL